MPDFVCSVAAYVTGVAQLLGALLARHALAASQHSTCVSIGVTCAASRRQHCLRCSQTGANAAGRGAKLVCFVPWSLTTALCLPANAMRCSDRCMTSWRHRIMYKTKGDTWWWITLLRKVMRLFGRTIVQKTTSGGMWRWFSMLCKYTQCDDVDVSENKQRWLLTAQVAASHSWGHDRCKKKDGDDAKTNVPFIDGCE